jgi:hypothetical protein
MHDRPDLNGKCGTCRRDLMERGDDGRPLQECP